MRARLLLAFLTVLALVLCSPAAHAEDPAPPAAREDADGITVHGMAGGVVSLASDAGAGVEPMAWINVDAPVADSEYAPHLQVDVVLAALPGETLNATDPATFRSIEAAFRASQPISKRVHFDLYAEGGFATRLPGEPEPRDRTARWLAGGVRFRSERGYLAMGVGADQRLTGTYRPAMTISGAVKLWQAKDATSKAPKGAMMVMVGSAILGLDAPVAGQPATRDVVRVGIALGI